MMKKGIAILLATMLGFSMIGCGATIDESGAGTDSIQNDIQEAKPMGDSFVDEEEENSAAEAWLYSDAKTPADALDVVAQLNGCSVEELNYCLDDRGCVNFLGANFTEKKVFSYEDAQECIDDLVLLAGAEGCEYVFYRQDVSPVSGYTYYLFSQVASSDLDDMLITYSNAQIRIMANNQGEVMGFSADVSPVENLLKIDAASFVDQTEAEELVKKELPEGCSVFSDMTELSYWDDNGSVSAKVAGKVAPVWIIYTNEYREGKPYTLYMVYASRMDDEAVIIDKVSTFNLNTLSDEYTSEFFFVDMEDAGYMDYTLDMTWAKQAGSGYIAADTIQVSVPIMYSPSQELYYLADYNERIAVANYYDFKNDCEVNALVTEDPSDLYSWRFASMEGPSGEEYFCNPEYVIAAYDAMEKAFHIYKDRYGYTSVDTSGMPILLLTYACGGEYPEEVSDMLVNAFNMGQWHDWAVFGTSPTYTGCAEVSTLCHEFAHGINGQLTNTQYMNDMGAVMEGYADSIGEYLAYLYGYKDELYKDLVGSDVTEPIRSFEDPYEYNNAKYIGGTYYVLPSDSSLAADLDNGGVHHNSSVVNYLAYNLYHSEDASDAVLTIGQLVDLFLETLYCANYSSGFTELGAYLLFAAESMDLDDATYAYVYDTITRFGFTGDDSALKEMIEAEGAIAYPISIVTDGEDEDEQDLSEDFTFGIWLEDVEADIDYLAGMVDEEGKLIYYLPQEKTYNALICIALKDWEMTVGYAYVEGIKPGENNEISVIYGEVEPGEVVDFETSIETVTYYDYYANDATVQYINDYDDTSVCFENAGLYCLSLMDEEENVGILILFVE